MSSFYFKRLKNLYKKMSDFSLSFDNIRDIPFEKYEKNFTFIVNDRRYETSRYVADILSPIIRGYHIIDETIDSFIIQTNDTIKTGSQSMSNDDESFLDFLNLAKFNQKTIKESHRNLFLQYFIQLGNINEYLRLQTEYFEGITSSNVIDRLQFITENVQIMKRTKDITKNYEILDKMSVQKMITYASSHFWELRKEKLKNLSKEMIEAIIRDDSLKLDEEDSLLSTIIELYEEDDQFSTLLEYVRFDNVSDECLSKFISTFNIENINASIWKSICERLQLSSKEEVIRKDERYLSSMTRKKGIKEFTPEPDHEFEGIMHYLTNQTTGNIHDNGTIKITTNSFFNNDNTYHPKNLVDYLNNNYYSSNDEPDTFICFDFKDRPIQLTNYAIKSHSSRPNYCHLRNWVIEVSNDNENWETVDYHSNDSRLNGSNITAIFKVNKELSDFYRFIRLRQTGYSWHSDYYIYFYFIEFFGKIDETTKKK